MQLSFSHIMKHWKRNPNQPGVTKVPGSSRNVLLRFYPPQSALGKSWSQLFTSVTAVQGSTFKPVDSVKVCEMFYWKNCHLTSIFYSVSIQPELNVEQSYRRMY
jgi:hypothetical protein